MSESLISSIFTEPCTDVSNPQMGPLSKISNAFPLAIPSDCWRSINTISANSFCARMNARVPPVCPAPIIDIFLLLTISNAPLFNFFFKNQKALPLHVNYNIEMTKLLNT